MEILYIEENQLKSRLLLSFQTYNKSFQERRVFFKHYAADIVDQLPRLGKRELICLLLFTCNYVISVWRGFLSLWVLGMGYVILLSHSLSLRYNHFSGKPRKLTEDAAQDEKQHQRDEG